ncbi:MAG: hypothetical protein ACOY46_07145 [Bacillota bacterium]
MLRIVIYFVELSSPGLKNALNVEMYDSLAEIMQKVQSDREIIGLKCTYAEILEEALYSKDIKKGILLSKKKKPLFKGD